MKSVGKHRGAGRLLTGLVFLFLYLPIIVLVIFSFNSSKSRKVWSGFTFEWYKELFSDQMILNSFYITILVAVLAAVIGRYRLFQYEKKTERHFAGNKQFAGH